jgi:uncharacterized membrane protein
VFREISAAIGVGGAIPSSGFEQAVSWIIVLIEAGGIAVVVLGLAGSSALFAWQLARHAPSVAAYRHYRANLGRSILLGLEFLVAADIIRTVVIELTIESISLLAALVLVRTFLSFALETEINKRPPWKEAPPAPEDQA